MTSNAILSLEDKSFNILMCSCAVEQKIDKMGNHSSAVRSGDIYLILEGTAESIFAKWMIDGSTKDGTITFKDEKRDKSKQIDFKGAYIYRLNESFVTEDDLKMEFEDPITDNFGNDSENEVYKEIVSFQTRLQMSYVMHCRITAEKVTIDGVDHANKWK